MMHGVAPRTCDKFACHAVRPGSRGSLPRASFFCAASYFVMKQPGCCSRLSFFGRRSLTNQIWYGSRKEGSRSRDNARIDIQDYARKLLEAHGDKAIAEAAQKASAFEQQGNRRPIISSRRADLRTVHALRFRPRRPTCTILTDWMCGQSSSGRSRGSTGSSMLRALSCGKTPPKGSPARCFRLLAIISQTETCRSQCYQRFAFR